MAFDIDLFNADTVTPECLARAIDLVVNEYPGRLILEIAFGTDFLAVQFVDGRKFIDFPVLRTGEEHAH